MSLLIQEIQSIRSLEANIRNPVLSPSVMKAIEMIHHSILNSSEGQGKKVDWRGNSSSNRYSSSSASTSTAKNHAFGSQQRTSYHNNGSNGNRFRNSTKESSVSIPLSSNASLPTSSDSVKSKDDDGFETVRHHSSRRPYHAMASSSSSSTHEPVHHEPSHSTFRPHPKYVSRFRKSTDNVEDSIMNKILGKLNKFSASNYQDIKEFITQIIDSGQTDMIKCFMKLVFEKAASEEMFCPLYARLLSELSAQYPILLDEMNNLYKQYMEIFEEIPTENQDESYQDLCQRNVEKKYRRGYSQFLAELIKHNVIDREIFMQTIVTIIHQVELNLTSKDSVKVIEEYADCLMKIMKAIDMNQKKIQTKLAESDSDDEKDSLSSITHVLNEIRSYIKKDIMSKIQPLTVRNGENIGLSNKARFTFLDIYEEIQKYNK